MSYRYAVQRDDYGDLASGLVLRSAPGLPAFPVRAASEIFQRAAELRGKPGRLTVWDPCCGSGYLITVLGFAHPDRIGALLATDICEPALDLAAANLRMLTVDGLADRARELAGLAELHGKASHRGAVEAAGRLSAQRLAVAGPPRTAVAAANVFDPAQLARASAGMSPDIVITDVPYGDRTDWVQAPGQAQPIRAALAALAAVVPSPTVIAVVDRARRVELGPDLRAVERVRIGHRAVAFVVAGQVGQPSQAEPPVC